MALRRSHLRRRWIFCRRRTLIEKRDLSLRRLCLWARRVPGNHCLRTLATHVRILTKQSAWGALKCWVTVCARPKPQTFSEATRWPPTPKPAKKKSTRCHYKSRCYIREKGSNLCPLPQQILWVIRSEWTSRRTWRWVVGMTRTFISISSGCGSRNSIISILSRIWTCLRPGWSSGNCGRNRWMKKGLVRMGRNIYLTMDSTKIIKWWSKKYLMNVMNKINVLKSKK